MDDRDSAKSKVVPLRRNGQSENGDREHVASKIFAEEDGIGTFSLGNLVPPKHGGSADDARGILPDGLEHEQEPSLAQGPDVDREPDEFLEELLARTSVGGPTDGGQPRAPTLPGSAYLPNELPATNGARRVSLRRLVEGLVTRRADVPRTMRKDTTGRTSKGVTRTAALSAVAIAVVASVVGAVVLGRSGHRRPSVRAPRASQSVSSIEPRPASAAAWAALREHTKAQSSRRHHAARPRHRKTARSHKSSSPTSPTVSCCASQTAQVQPPPSESSPQTSAGSGGTRSGSTSGGSGATRHSAKPGPTGRVSLIGAGTTPSG